AIASRDTGMFVITVLVAVSIGVTDPFLAECRLWFTTQATGAEAAAAPSGGLAMPAGPGRVTAANASATPEIKPTPCLIMGLSLVRVDAVWPVRTRLRRAARADRRGKRPWPAVAGLSHSPPTFSCDREANQ